MRAVIYCRFSSDQQKATSLVDQERICREYIQQQGWTTVEVYKDAAISGTHDERPAYQQMLNHARAGQFEVLVAEDLDRLNRRLEHTAHLYNQLQFVGIEIYTLSHGQVGDLQVGISGLMGELYIKNLAQKTRRGLEGRVRDGKSGGGRAYGYDVVHSVDADGNPTAGERQINEAEAEIIREIFHQFAAGDGPRKIASDLNARNLSGPRGRKWSDTSIRGHAKKGTGVLNNTLYIGKHIWGRQTYVKNPSTGRRVARLNAPDSIVTVDVPHLRIVDDALWQAVKARQSEVSRPRTDPHVTNPLNDMHRPRFLLSGLLTCGVCGGGYTIRGKDRYACARRANQGTCGNNRTIKRQNLEHRILAGLKQSLVTPDLVAEFVEAYVAEHNRLVANHSVLVRQREKELADVERRIKAIIDAIEQGILTPTTKERLVALEADKAQLQTEPAPEPSSIPVLHPNLAEVYRGKVAQLEVELNDPLISADAKNVLRSLIDKIVVVPGEKRGQVHLELHGELASILAMTVGKRNNSGTAAGVDQISVVAGARNRLNLQLREVLFAALEK